MMPEDPSQNEERELNLKDKPPLSEKNFIQNKGVFFSFPFWLWIALCILLVSLIWGAKGSYHQFVQKEKTHDPFLEVTNREFSVFLWQFPSFLRNQASKKIGYLPGFLISEENMDPLSAEEFVSAPPDLVFLYHTWNRLLTLEFIERPISPKEFGDFLKQLPEWQPKNWTKAPAQYIQLIETENYTKIENMQILPQEDLPLIVRQAFIGWKNYFIEGDQINKINPTYIQVKDFLDQHPHYKRNYWRNIQMVYNREVAGENYLSDLKQEVEGPEAPFPIDELSSFLKVGLFNAEQAQQNK